MSAKFQKFSVCTVIQSIRPSGSVNKLGGPKQVILVALGDDWVERSPLGGCPPSTFYLGSKTILFIICDLL